VRIVPTLGEIAIRGVAESDANEEHMQLEINR
jgi:hypothetical protein